MRERLTPISRHWDRLLRELEGDYPGLVEELEPEALEEDSAGEATADQPARVSLRSADVSPALFDYQEDLASQFESVCAAASPSNIALLALPTGAGKTRTAAVGLLRVLSAGCAATALWLAPTRELLTQAANTTRDVWSAYRAAVDLELVRADRLPRYPDDLRRGILFATPQMVAARLRRGRVPNPDVVVFDEAHHVEAPVFRHGLTELRKRHGTAVIGLSATPGRTSEEETERLVDFFRGRLLWSGKLLPNPIRVLQQRGVLAHVEFKDVPVPPRSRLPRVSRSAEALASDADRFRALIRLTKEVSRGARVLVFTASVRHAHVAATVLRREGVSAGVVSSYSPEDVRRDALRDFESGALSVLLNKSLLATGYDCPAIRHVVLATTVQSAILFEQIVGRASRGPLVGGNARSTVWQFEDHLAMHGLPQSYHRYADYDWRALRRN